MSGEDVANNTNEVAAAGDVPKTVVDPETTIFVGNIAADVTKDDLKQVFQEEYGDQLEVETPEPSKNAKGKVLRRYAFIKFPNKIDVEAIKSKYDKTVIKEKGIFIRKALTEEERENQKKAKKQQQRNNAKKGTKYRNGRFSYAVSAPPNKEKPPLDEMERSTDTLYVNNIPYSATKEQLAEFFGTKPELITLPMRRMKTTKTNKFFYSNKMNRGIAFVRFENLQVDIKKKVDEFQSKTLQDRQIAVDVAAKLRQPKEGETTNEDQQQNNEQDGNKKEKKQEQEEQEEKSESKK